MLTSLETVNVSLNCVNKGCGYVNPEKGTFKVIDQLGFNPFPDDE